MHILFISESWLCYIRNYTSLNIIVTPFIMSLTVLALLLLLVSVNLVNGQNNDNSSVECPFRLSCSRYKNQYLEFPSKPVSKKFLIRDIDCKLKNLVLSDSQKCLPRLFLTNNFSLFYPFQSDSSYNNITFFNCSSVGVHHLKSWYQRNPGVQDMLSCPIYATDPYESVVDLDLLSCTRMFDKVLPVSARFHIMFNTVRLSWSETTFPSQCLEYDQLHHKSKKKLTSIILVTTGE